ALKVTDLEKATKFYENVFGFRQLGTGHSRGHISRHMTDGDLDLALMLYDSEDVEEAQWAGAGPRIHHWGIEVADKSSFAEVIEGAEPHLDMGALYELSLKHAVPPILLSRKIKGFPDDHRIVCNVRSSRVLNDGAGLELVQNYRKHRRKTSAPIASEYVDAGPVLDNVRMDNEVDILAFPAPQWHGNDGGQYIGTECMVIAQDPDSDWVNSGT